MGSSKHQDFIVRGVKHPSPLNRAIFVTLRALTPPLLYLLLATPILPNLLSSIGLESINISAPLLSVDQAVSNLASPFNAPKLGLSALGLSLPRALLLGGSTLAVAKQVYWVLFVSQETFSLFNAVAVAIFNSVTEIVEVTLYFWQWSSATSPVSEAVTGPIAFGAGLLVLGVSTEWLAEYQRKGFKEDSRNQGKVFQGGLFGMARHINFAGFAAWKAGQVYMSAGWVAGTVIGVVFLRFFHRRAIPPLDEYCQERYGAQWTRYKKDVPSKLIPWVW